MNIALRILLLVWVIGFLVLSCAPLLNGHLLIGTVMLAAGIALFVPWLIGIAVLVGLIWLTNPRRRL